MSRFALLIVVSFLFSCSPNNVTIDNGLKKYFDENKMEGCFALFDNAQEQFTIYNLSRYRDSAYSPASTFKIVNGLVGLKTGVIFDEKMIIPWDKINRPIEAWNHDLTMEQAFKASSVPYFQEVARRIGKDTMQQWLDSLNYGNKKISRIDSFWLDNTLKITPDEQLGLVKKLFFEKLPMDKRPQRIMKEVMLQEDNANYRLSYKTGMGTLENGKRLGWVVGWIEESRRPYFFVLNVEGNDDPHFADNRIVLLKSILRELGFFEGKK